MNMQGQLGAEQRTKRPSIPAQHDTAGFVSLDFRATGKAGRALQSSCWYQ